MYLGWRPVQVIKYPPAEGGLERTWFNLIPLSIHHSIFNGRVDEPGDIWRGLRRRLGNSTGSISIPSGNQCRRGKIELGLEPEPGLDTVTFVRRAMLTGRSFRGGQMGWYVSFFVVFGLWFVEGGYFYRVFFFFFLSLLAFLFRDPNFNMTSAFSSSSYPPPTSD